MFSKKRGDECWTSPFDFPDNRAPTDLIGADPSTEVNDQIPNDRVARHRLDAELVTRKDEGEACVGGLAVDLHHAAVADFVSACVVSELAS